MHDLPDHSSVTPLITPTEAGEDPKMLSNIRFGPFSVANQVFHVSPARLSFSLVNLKPLLPGHVLVCPVRCAPRLSMLTPTEVADLFKTVQRVSHTIERVYKASALNVAVQDGVDAGQSVPHVHVHIIPRQADDLKAQGGSDQIYAMMDDDEGNLGKVFLEMQKLREKRINHRDFVSGPDADRKPRSDQEMNEEAVWLKKEMAQDHIDESDGTSIS